MRQKSLLFLKSDHTCRQPPLNHNRPSLQPEMQVHAINPITQKRSCATPALTSLSSSPRSEQACCAAAKLDGGAGSTSKRSAVPTHRFTTLVTKANNPLALLLPPQQGSMTPTRHKDSTPAKLTSPSVKYSIHHATWCQNTTPACVAPNSEICCTCVTYMHGRS